jgi:enoyl-[acyl-carrier-protein] reductase (NADH)
LISLLLSQISENKELARVFSTLFSSEGSELYLKPADDYVKAGSEVNFYTVVEAARRKGEAAIGYRIRSLANDAGRHYGVRINPVKSERVKFVHEDRIIVIAKN